MQQYQIPYRGYSIKTERRDLCWAFTLERTRPDLPGFQAQPFWTATQSERLAVAQARQRVDHALEAWKPIPAQVEHVIADRSWVDLGLQTSEILSGHLPPLRHALL